MRDEYSVDSPRNGMISFSLQSPGRQCQNGGDDEFTLSAFKTEKKVELVLREVEN